MGKESGIFIHMTDSLCCTPETNTTLKVNYTPIKKNFFCLFRATPAAYGGSQARGLIGAVAAGLHHSHSNAGSQPSLQPTSQLTATLDP